jgi:EAL domain-containing protein (putative c-di-GMP-specific phosphodiesterase class I)
MALDDFGTGFSSLSYLTLLQPKIIKIDRSFVSPAVHSAYNDVLLEAITSLGRNLNMTVVAEGIESRQQLERLVQIGCALGQGYLFSPAVPKNDLGPMLDSRGRNWTSSHFAP